MGYDAFVYANENNEQEIDDIINYIEIEYYEINEMLECYVKIILEVAISIVEFFPYKSLDILKSINETYAILKSIPSETLDLSVEIIYNIAKDDLEKALELLDDVIEIDYFKYDTLIKIDNIYNSIDVKNRIIEVKNRILEYDKEYFED